MGWAPGRVTLEDAGWRGKRKKTQKSAHSTPTDVRCGRGLLAQLFTVVRASCVSMVKARFEAKNVSGERCMCG
jgi:hypothetical protein